MKVLIFGVSGMLGHKLYQELDEVLDLRATVRGSLQDVVKYGFFDPVKIIEHLDVTDEISVRKAIEAARPDVVINAAGIVKQSPSSKDTLVTLSVNSIFPLKLSEMSEEYGFRLLTISTDCVFDGRRGNYSELDTPNATDVYGKSKSLGELDSGRSLTIRTSIIGRELGKSHQGLVEWFLSNRGGTVKGFTRAVFSGFSTIILADMIRTLIFDFPDLKGIYHVSSDPINKYDLLRILNDIYGSDIEILADDSLEIDRSLDSTRFRAVTGFSPLGWQEMVQKMAADPTDYDKWK